MLSCHGHAAMQVTSKPFTRHPVGLHSRFSSLPTATLPPDMLDTENLAAATAAFAEVAAPASCLPQWGQTAPNTAAEKATGRQTVVQLQVYKGTIYAL